MSDRSYPFKGSLFVLILGLFVSGCASSLPPELTWDKVLYAIREKFPDVASISTDKLERWISVGEEYAPVLLDVRTVDEFEVSHLYHAWRVSPNDKIRLGYRGLKREQPIVVYDSVGFRAASFARRLQQAGYWQVCYLEGSIFKWANEGRALYKGEKKVTMVHPCDSYWGKLLNPEYRALSLVDLGEPVY
ncbi:rhodanese-like domain-containing protein [Methylacidiphilum caldifontis]|uniref:rhodanese-like domain-containing protein n=1 Tax=Methylacidiphilum caldifontis TaxID=2795386 RepID=UPI001A8D5602|nr:rhodanese-like domain-containing protein [Methylacidiphilum caldifontis]QSR89450.1 rhodanese-like domain-containing protein [Methylacidiphilum caldifontis]